MATRRTGQAVNLVGRASDWQSDPPPSYSLGKPLRTAWATGRRVVPSAARRCYHRHHAGDSSTQLPLSRSHGKLAFQRRLRTVKKAEHPVSDDRSAEGRLSWGGGPSGRSDTESRLARRGWRAVPPRLLEHSELHSRPGGHPDWAVALASRDARVRQGRPDLPPRNAQDAP